MKYDVVVIGAGPGGYVAAVRAAGYGMSVAVVERDALGGVCLNWGCIPTKALLKSAQAMHYALRAEEFGFSASDVSPDIRKIVERSRNVAATMSKGIEYLFKKNGVTLVSGNARLLSGRRVEVSGPDGVSVLEYGRVIIATGSHPASLPFAPFDGKRIISYRQALVPETLPESMVVIGSGAIGSELAFFYRSLGVDVTIVEFMERILPLEDDDVCAQVSRQFRKGGMKVMTGSSVRKIDVSDGLCKVFVDTPNGEQLLDAEVVLSAVGVRPNTGNLGLEELGVKMERGRITVDGNYMTNVDGIYAIGDVIPTPALAHVASAEAVACVDAIAGKNLEPVDYRYVPACTYIAPEVASVGMTERAAKEKGLSYRCSKFLFTASGRAAAAGARDGFVKLVVEEGSDRILGVHIVGDNASEMIGGMVIACRHGVTATELAKTIFPHPTMSEGIMEAADIASI